MQAQPSQFTVESFAVLLAGEVAVFNAPVGHGASDAVNHLLHAGFAFLGVGFPIKIFAHHHVGGQGAPTLGNLAVGLLKNQTAVFIFHLGRTGFPFHGVKRIDIRRAKMRLDGNGLG